MPWVAAQDVMLMMLGECRESMTRVAYCVSTMRDRTFTSGSSRATWSTPSLRAHSSSRAPSAANAFAIAAPIPRLAPVTSATRPSSSIEADSVLAKDLARLGHRAHRQDVVGVEHHIERAFDLGHERRVTDRVPFLDRVVGEIVADALQREAA